MERKFDGITIDVNAKLNVDQNTAEGCLKLVEIFLNDHSDLCVQVTRNEDGTESYKFVRRYSNVREQQPDSAAEGS